MNTIKDLNNIPLCLTNAYIKNKFDSIDITFTDPNEYNTDKYNCAREGVSVYYALYRKNIDENYIILIDKIRRTNFNAYSKVIYNDKTANPKNNYIYYITALDRLHNESEAVIITNNKHI